MVAIHFTFRREEGYILHLRNIIHITTTNQYMSIGGDIDSGKWLES
jgi:hypothetical protein